MSIKHSLILLTLVSVVADTMLLPFYPQFFASAFHYNRPEHVGYYIAACSFTVMVVFPVWAKVAKNIHELHIWIPTQILAAALGLACYFTHDLVIFWILSLSMLVFKASYLLIYPYVMRLEGDEGRLGVAGLFSVLMHFGAIGGAIIGGFILEYFPPRSVFLIMVASDLLQVLVCAYLIFRHQVPFLKQVNANTDSAFDTRLTRTIAKKVERESPSAKSSFNTLPLLKQPSFIMRLGIVTLLFYFSAFLIRPFFTLHWESVTEVQNDLLTALIYAIPAWVAILGLALNQRKSQANNSYKTVFTAFFIALIGVALQSTADPILIIVGRCIYAWALFQITVRLEVILFNLSHQDDFALNFSKIHIFQNVGVVLASISVGSMISLHGLLLPFGAALVGLTLTTLIFYRFYKSNIGLKWFAEQGKDPA